MNPVLLVIAGPNGTGKTTVRDIRADPLNGVARHASLVDGSAR